MPALTRTLLLPAQISCVRIAAQSALRAPQGGGLTLDRGYDAILACAGGVHSCKME